jgi:hypothetical protein
MATIEAVRTTPRSRVRLALVLLLLAQYVGVGVLFPLHAFTSPLGSPALQAFAVLLALCALLAIYGVWRGYAWGAWVALAVLSCKLTVDVYNWALALDRALLPLSEIVNGSVALLLFLMPAPASKRIARPQKIFFAAVLVFAGNVGLIGMFNPGHIGATLPFDVPRLHARFLGAMYLSGTTFMLLAILARRWREIHVVVPMVAIWTGTLGLVSLLHLDVFDWAREQVWAWFAAYIGFPLIAAWIAWQQRAVHEHASGPSISPALRAWFIAFGILVTLLAVALFVAPAAMARRWPWAITPLVAQIYSAPFLSYGIGSLLAARRRDWPEVRIVVYATLVFTLGVLVASIVHRALFDAYAPATWLWFGGFALVSAGLLAFALVHRLRTTHASKEIV